MLRKLVAALIIAAVLTPIPASASYLYITVKRLKVEDRKLASGCGLTLRTPYEEQIRCYDDETGQHFPWHIIHLLTNFYPERTCELRVVLGSAGAFKRRWHAEFGPNSYGTAQCKLHWHNDNTLEINSGIIR